MARRGRPSKSGKRNASGRLITQPQTFAPTPEQLARGTYERGFIMDDDGRNAMAHRNLATDPVMLWQSKGLIDHRQKAAIDHVRRLWRLVGVRQRVTVNYAEPIRGAAVTEQNSAEIIAARRDLARVEGYLAGNEAAWSRFENACRFGIEPDASAIAPVQLVADKIADMERL